MPAQRVDIKYVREHADFAAVLAHYGVALKGDGPQRSALCPFHRERKGSFKVNLERRLFNCFGCDAHGNVIDFVMQSDDVDAREAAITVAEICDIPTAPPKGEKPAREPRVPSRRSKGAAAKDTPPEVDEAPPEEPPDETEEDEDNEAIEQPTANSPLGFALKLDPDHPYLTARVSQATIETFGLGFCGRGIMKNRVAIPIHNAGGELVAYAGRWADEEPPDDVPRYLLPKQFHKQLELFNVHRLPDPVASVVLVESYWSVFRLHELGVSVVSPMGRSMSRQQIELLAGRGVTHVTVLFDGDEPGRSGTEKMLPALARSCFVYAPDVPDGFKPHSADEALLKKLAGGL
ncbi:MAG: CHC2 zinc finger domain-containing protein [Kiloniellales bacterium]|nr:CHC2 zinc finger domain-containing protein [Kiloniellales bacterium]